MEKSTLYHYRYHNIDVTFVTEAPEEVVLFLEDWGLAGFSLLKAILFCYKAEIEGREKKKGTIYPSPEVLSWIRNNLVHYY